MKKRTILITGGSQGIGRAIALSLANDQSQIVITYAGNKAKAEKVVEELEEKGASAMALPFNLHETSKTPSLFTQIEASFGAVDILISNAFGKSIFKPLALVEAVDFEETFASVRGTFFLLQEAARHLSKGGTILALSSGATTMPVPAGGLYAGAKAAIEHFALSMAKELGERQINVNVVMPGVTQTEGLVAPQEMIDQLVAQTPLGRLGKPEDVAMAIARLAHPDNHWVNMQRIGINGGIL